MTGCLALISSFSLPLKGSSELHETPHPPTASVHLSPRSSCPSVRCLAATVYAEIVDHRDRMGTPLSGYHAQIAAICRVNGARLATTYEKALPESELSSSTLGHLGSLDDSPRWSPGPAVRALRDAASLRATSRASESFRVASNAHWAEPRCPCRAQCGHRPTSHGRGACQRRSINDPLPATGGTVTLRQWGLRSSS